MSQSQATLLRHNGRRHRRGKIIDHNDGIRLMRLQLTLELRHHPTRQLVQILTLHTQEHIGPGHLQILE